MKILFDKTDVLGHGKVYIAVEDEFITYIGENRPDTEFDRVIDTKNKLVIPGLYNCHTHSAMQFMRGYGEDMPLDRWLNDKIFPAEDRLTPETVYLSSKFAIAEMIRNGIASFSDMYYFCEQTAKCVGETGIKANISRSIVSFDNEADHKNDVRFIEAKSLFEDYNGSFDGRLKVDMSLHAEYTNVEKMCRVCADYAKENDASFHIHLSETEKEHNECIKRHGMTPLEFFENAGVLSVPTNFAHCVWVSESDMDIMKKHGCTATHNPASNLKLGSGVMPLSKMLEKGINVALGTDSSASNNTLDIIKEMYLAAILQKGTDHDPSKIKAESIVKLATVNGAMAQGREKCGELKVGNRADIVMIDLDAINNIPMFDPTYALVYSANASNVCFNMVDGRILFEKNEFTTVDIEKLKYDMKKLKENYFSF